MPVFIAMMVQDRRLKALGKEFVKFGYVAVPREKLHMTLLFIGDVDSYHLHVLKEALSKVFVNHSRILEIGNMMLLPHHKATNVAVEVKVTKELMTLRNMFKEVVENVIEINDRYGFLPHITIARRFRPPSPEIIEEIEKFGNKLRKRIPRTVYTQGIALVRSIAGTYNVELWLSEPVIHGESDAFGL